MIDLPPNLPEQVVCSIQASEQYDLAPEIVLSVAQAEGGHVGQWVKNTNGTYDVGVMQFNTAYLKSLEKFGITPDHVAGKGCFPYKLASWRIKKHITEDEGDLWTKVANYHSRTPRFNAIYRDKLIHFAKEWQSWLKAPTLETLPWLNTKGKSSSVVTGKSLRALYPTFEDYLKANGF